MKVLLSQSYPVNKEAMGTIDITSISLQTLLVQLRLSSPIGSYISGYLYDGVFGQSLMRYSSLDRQSGSGGADLY